MAGINARKKGQRGEKQAIAFLEDWTGMEFARTPASGGLRWGKAENISGDVVCIEKNYIFPLSIEVKFNKEINFEHLLYPKTVMGKKEFVPKIKEFWIQTIRDARRAEKIPMLLMRYNGMPSGFFFVVMSATLFGMLDMQKLNPYLIYSKGVIITNTIALSKIPWNTFEDIVWQKHKERYGKVGK